MRTLITGKDIFDAQNILDDKKAVEWYGQAQHNSDKKFEEMNQPAQNYYDEWALELIKLLNKENDDNYT